MFRARCFDLVEISGHIGRRQIDQPVVFWRGFDVTMLAGEIAQGVGIEPQRLERLQRNLRTRFPLAVRKGSLSLRGSMATTASMRRTRLLQFNRREDPSR